MASQHLSKTIYRGCISASPPRLLKLNGTLLKWLTSPLSMPISHHQPGWSRLLSISCWPLPSSQVTLTAVTLAGNDTTLSEWSSATDAVLLYDPKEPCLFTSGHWNTGINPELAFAKPLPYEPLPTRHVLDRLP